MDVFQYHKCATFQSHTCKGCAMFVTPVSVLGKSDKVVFTVMEVEKVCFSTRNVVKFNFHNCRVV